MNLFKKIKFKLDRFLDRFKKGMRYSDIKIPRWCMYGCGTANHGLMGCWSLISGYRIDGSKGCKKCDEYDKKYVKDKNHESEIIENQKQLKEYLAKLKSGKES